MDKETRLRELLAARDRCLASVQVSAQEPKIAHELWRRDLPTIRCERRRYVPCELRSDTRCKPGIVHQIAHGLRFDLAILSRLQLLRAPGPVELGAERLIPLQGAEPCCLVLPRPTGEKSQALQRGSDLTLLPLPWWLLVGQQDHDGPQRNENERDKQEQRGGGTSRPVAFAPDCQRGRGARSGVARPRPQRPSIGDGPRSALGCACLWFGQGPDRYRLVRGVADNRWLLIVQRLVVCNLRVFGWQRDARRMHPIRMTRRLSPAALATP